MSMRLLGYQSVALIAGLLMPMAFLMGNYLLVGISIVSFIAAIIKIYFFDPMDDME